MSESQRQDVAKLTHRMPLHEPLAKEFYADYTSHNSRNYAAEFLRQCTLAGYALLYSKRENSDWLRKAILGGGNTEVTADALADKAPHEKDSAGLKAAQEKVTDTEMAAPSESSDEQKNTSTTTNLSSSDVKAAVAKLSGGLFTSTTMTDAE